MKAAHGVKVGASVVFLAALAGCVMGPAGHGTFEKTLAVSGPVRIEVETGSGEIQISRGPAGQIRVHGEFEVFSFMGERTNRVEEITNNPPIVQQGDSIRIGQNRRLLENVRVSYTITAPEDAVIRASAGSGNISVSGLRGPVRLSAGSGNLTGSDISGDVELKTGSGNQHLTSIGGTVHADAGSGNLEFDIVRNEIRAQTGSGRIIITRPAARVQVEARSGDIRITDAASDLQANTGSGRVEVSGRPQQRFYWDVRTRSGNVSIDLGPSASYRLEARSSSGQISTDVPLTVEEQDRRLLRARVGDGLGRVTVETGSGRIRIR